ncbi:MAG: hypothetical protein QM755_22775 [Luteolibacter sp.]
MILLHCLLASARRFRWEIGTWWLLSALGSGILLFRNPGSGPIDGLAWLDLLPACWLAIRIALSEATLRTQGGWQTRPIPRNVIHFLPLLLFAGVCIPPLVMRALAFQFVIRPSFSQWTEILCVDWLWAMGLVFLLLLITWLIGMILARYFPSTGKKALLILSAGLLVLGIARPMFLIRLAPSVFSYSRSFGWNNISEPWPLYATARRMLPPGARLIEPIDSHLAPQDVDARLLLRVPLQEGGTARDSGVGGQISSLSPSGKSMGFELSLLCGTNKLASETRAPMLIVHYGDGHYASCSEVNINADDTQLAVFGLRSRKFFARAPLPTQLPGNSLASPESYLPGSELLVFVANYGAQPRNPANWQTQEKANAPSTSPDPLQRLTDDTLNRYDFESRFGSPDPDASLPPGLISYLLKRPFWSDYAWEGVVRDYLLKHATEADKPALIKRLADDPRMTEVFIAKGWRQEVLPLLKHWAKERISIPSSGLQALAEEKDSALYADISALAFRLGSEVETLEGSFKAQPGFDWPLFVKAGWKYVKYQRPSWDRRYATLAFANWAAQEGDPLAMRRVGEEAARGDEDARKKLSALVGKEEREAVPYLRAHLDQFTWNPQTRLYEVH